jgi:7-cyano-7-deazaguanine synthase in queuosine biosynthesis
VCGSCQERAEAFTNVGWLDPALAHFREQANRQV